MGRNGGNIGDVFKVNGSISPDWSSDPAAEDAIATNVQMQSVAGGGRICFRGDDREPSTMFRAGFFSRRINGSIRYNEATPAPLLIREEHASTYKAQGFKTVVGKTFDPSGMSPSEIYERTLDGKSPKGMHVAIVPRTADIDSPSAVCISPRFSMAILFPPKANAGDQKEYTWVYAVFVRELYNTHAQQVCDGLKAIEGELGARDKTMQSGASPYGGTALRDAYVENVALWPLYAQELATKKIEPADIICAIRVKRTWKGKDFTFGCDYDLFKKTLRFNRRCTVDKSQVKAIKAFLKLEPDNGTTPSRDSGFHKDDENTRVSIAMTHLNTKIQEMMKHLPAVTEDDSDVADSEWD